MIYSKRFNRVFCVYSSKIGISHLCVLLILSSFTMSEEVAQTTVLQGNNYLTKSIYQILARNEGNIFFSPISIHAILSMAAQGSGGSTKSDLIKVLGIEETNIAADGYQEIMNSLNYIENITLYMANKIFLMKGYEMKESFKEVVVRNFYSDVEQLDFSAAVESANIINTWVEEKTNNKIKNLIASGDLNKDSRLVLVNAIYFKGNWAEKFKIENTRREKFYLRDGNTVDVNMMHLKSKRMNYKFDEELDAQVLEMPYENKEVSMVFILPDKKDGIAQLEEKLIQTDLTKITENMRKSEVELSIPKFKIETTLDLGRTLTEIGLGSIFSRSANFSEMLNSPEQLYVSKVIQKAFIEVNEDGAEAAAATAKCNACGAVDHQAWAFKCPKHPTKPIEGIPNAQIKPLNKPSRDIDENRRKDTKVHSNITIHDHTVNTYIRKLNKPNNNNRQEILQKLNRRFIREYNIDTQVTFPGGMIVMMRKAARPTPPKVFQADHPFVIKLIRRNNNSCNVLFSGRISKPIY